MPGNKNERGVHRVAERLDGAESGIQFSAQYVADLRHAHRRHRCNALQGFSQMAAALL